MSENNSDDYTSESDREKTVILTAECPMSWCGYVAVVEDPDSDYDAAYEIRDHVNEDHSEKDLETLRTQDTETERGGRHD